jgi:Tat protein translocase TatB subunit
MFGLGFFELLLIGLTVIILVKPDDYPKLARKCGELVRKYRQMWSIIQNEVQEISDLDKHSKRN